MDQYCNTELEYRKYFQRLFSFINSRIRDEKQSEDILQETFLKFEECSQTGCQCQYPKSYLFKMALNAIADFFKNKNREAIIEKELMYQSELALNKSQFPCDVYQCAHQYLAKLSPDNQLAFIKSDIEQIPQKDIAEELGIPVSTLKSRVQRTRLYIRREFEKCLKNY